MAKPTEKPLRVVFDASPLIINKTGVAYYTERLIVQLAKQYPDQLELHGFYYNFLGRRPVDHLPQAPNLHWHAVRLLPSKVVYQLRRWDLEVPVEFLAKTKADFILFPNFLSYPSLFSTPSAPVIHDLTYIDLPKYVSPKNRRDLQRYVPKAIKRSSFILTVSNFVKSRIVEEYGVEPKSILVNHIPPSTPVLTTAEERSAELKKWGITKPFILFLGTVDPRKNIIGLIDGYLALPEELRDKYSLVLVGRIERFAGAEAEKINAVQAAGYDVIHVGYVSDEAKEIFYQTATMFVHASNYEGFGMPLLEAMTHKLACAVSDIPVFREVAGDNALYFDYQDPASIARVLKQLLENPKKLHALASAGKAHADSFSWQSVAKDIYDRITASLKR